MDQLEGPGHEVGDDDEIQIKNPRLLNKAPYGTGERPMKEEAIQEAEEEASFHSTKEDDEESEEEIEAWGAQSHRRLETGDGGGTCKLSLLPQHQNQNLIPDAWHFSRLPGLWLLTEKTQANSVAACSSEGNSDGAAAWDFF